MMAIWPDNLSVSVIRDREQKTCMYVCMYIPDLYSALIRANVPFKGALQQRKKEKEKH
jgi:hypothetical protein